MALKAEITRFEERFAEDGSLRAVEVEVRLTDEELGEGQYAPKRLTLGPEDLATYAAVRGTPGERGVVRQILARHLAGPAQAWRDAARRRPPEPVVLGAEEAAERFGAVPLEGPS